MPKKSKKDRKTNRTRRYKRGGASGALKYSKRESYENEMIDIISRITDEEIEIFNGCFDEELMLTTIEILMEYYLNSIESMKMKVSFMKKLNQKYDKHLVDLHLNNLMVLDVLCIDYISGLLDEKTENHLVNFFKKLLIVVLGLSVENNPSVVNFLRDNLRCDVNSFKHNFEPLTGGGKKGVIAGLLYPILFNESIQLAGAEPITMSAVAGGVFQVLGMAAVGWQTFSWYSDISIGVVKVDSAVQDINEFGRESMDIAYQIDSLSDDVINELGERYVNKWENEMKCKSNYAGCDIATILLSRAMEENNFTPLKDVPTLPGLNEYLEQNSESGFPELTDGMADLELIKGRKMGTISRKNIDARVNKALSKDLIECHDSNTCTHKQNAEYNFLKAVEEVNYVIDEISDASSSIKGRVAPVLTEIIKIDMLVKSMRIYKSIIGDEFVDDIATTYTGEALKVLDKIEGPEESYLDQVKTFFISGAKETQKRLALAGLFKDAMDYGTSRTINSVSELYEILRESTDIVIRKDVYKKTARLKSISNDFSEAHKSLGTVGTMVALTFDGLVRNSFYGDSPEPLEPFEELGDS